MGTAFCAPMIDGPADVVGRRVNARGLFYASAVFTILSLAAAISSTGFMEADGISHFLIARHAWTDLGQMIGVWGRPLVTFLYSIPAQIPNVRGAVIGVRIVSLLLALVTAVVTFRVAARQGYRWPALAAIALLSQPLFFLHSFSELTEIPFACVVILAFWAYQCRRYVLMALLVGISPMARPEGFGLMLLAGAGLLLHRRWLALALLPVPVLLWSYAGWVIYARPEYGLGQLSWLVWVPRNSPYSINSMYGRGGLFDFFGRMPIVTGPIFFPAVCVGVWTCLASGRLFGDHRKRCDLLIAAIPLAIFAGHSFLRWRGLMASSGELRYMLAVAPFWALLAGRGWELAFERLRLGRPIISAAVAALLPILGHAAHPVLPFVAQADDRLAKRVADWYADDQALRRDYPRVAPSFVGVYLFMDINKDDQSRTAPACREVARQAPPGTLLIWDAKYGPTNADARMCITWDDIMGSGKWIERERLVDGERQWHVFVSIRKAGE